MRKLLLMVFLPAAMFALEKVNLIKDAGFEKNSELWLQRTGGIPSDTAIANRHDPEKAYSGSFSGSCDTRNPDNTNIHDDSAWVIRGFCCEKTAADIDSLTIHYAVSPYMDDFSKICGGFMGIYIDAGKESFWFTGYAISAVGPEPIFLPPIKMLDVKYITDSSWQSLNKAIRNDLNQIGVSSNASVDSIKLFVWGTSGGGAPWRGQKIYFDDIRLTGYADYDVGVKEILSDDSIVAWIHYLPTARIKNFGRKPADSFLVIAQIEGGSGVVYADTLSWSLTADTEDTISFKEFMPSDAASYTLTVSTVMMPDESDEDDVMSKTLYGSGVSEQPMPQALNLDALSLQAGEGVLRVSYSLPLGEQGTISLYDPSGRRIESLPVIGSGSVSFKSNLSSGVYFVKLETGKASATKKTVIIR